MAVLSSVQALATTAEVDTVLADSTAWGNLTADQKTANILLATIYLKSRFTCPGVDFDAPPNVMKEAVALLAFEAMSGNIYPAGGGATISGTITEESVQAGPVKETIKYEAGTAVVSTDEFPIVSGLLTGVCTLSTVGSSKGGSLPLERV